MMELSSFILGDLNVYVVLKLTLLLILVLVALSVWTSQRSSTSDNTRLPPGPPSLPIVGHLLAFDGNKNLLTQLSAWRAEFGDIFTVWFGSHPVVVLNSPDVIRRIIIDKGEITGDRPTWTFLTTKGTGTKGLVWTNDYRPHRRFAQRALRDFGVGKTSLEMQIQAEITTLTNSLDDVTKEPIDLHMYFYTATSNVIISIAFSKRFRYDDNTFAVLVENMNDLLKDNLLYAVANFLPWLFPVSLILQRKTFARAFTGMTALREFIQKHVREHHATFDADHIRDMADLYIQLEKQPDPLYQSISDGRVVPAVLDLFMAGTETTATTLTWVVLYLLHYPHVQHRVRQEILQTIGRSRSVSCKDVKQLPYTQAMLLEVQRIASVAPLSVVHNTCRELDLGDYRLPRDTMIISNLHQVHHDESYWTEPHVFRPERWLDEECNLINHNDYFIPFGIGPRMCIGDQLAKMELFLFAAAFIQQFDFEPADRKELPSLEGVLGVTYHTKPYMVQLTRL